MGLRGMGLSEQSTFGARFRAVPFWIWIAGPAVLIYAIVATAILTGSSGVASRFRLSLEPLLTASPAIQAHVAGAVMALGFGIVLFSLPKGRGLHKWLGWSWVVAMTITALSSFFITGLIKGSFSPIHALSGWTLISLPIAISAIRRRNVKTHRNTMTSLFVAGLIVAGLFSFLPGRLMWAVLFST